MAQTDPRRRRPAPAKRPSSSSPQKGRQPVRTSSSSRSQMPAKHAPPPRKRPHSSSKRSPPTAYQAGDPRAGQIRQVQQRRKRKRKRNYTLYYILLFFFLTVAGIILSLTVFFNIRTIEVVGSSIYTEEDVLPILGASEGDNLLRISTEKLEENVSAGLLRADHVEVKRIFPSTLRIEVTDGVPVVQLESDEKWYSVSASGRILEILSQPDSEHGVLILGLDLSGLQVGDLITQKSQPEIPGDEDSEAAASAYQNRLQTIQSFFSALKEAQVSGVTAIDCSDEIKLTFYWENRIKVVLGSFSELTYKLQLCRAILENPSQLPAEAIGILDAEEASTAGVFYQENAELELPGGGLGGIWNWDDDQEKNDPEDSSQQESSSLEESSISEPSEDVSSDLSSEPVSQEASDISSDG